MLEEVCSEINRIAKGKRFNNICILIYIYLIRFLIAFIPVVLLAIIKFLFGIFSLANLDFITSGFNILYEILVAILSYVTFIATSPFMFGGLNYFYNEVKNDNTKEKLSKYLSNSKLCFKQMILIFIISMFTLMGLCFLIVPGVIFLSYTIMAPFILIDDESKSIKECLLESKKIMKGRVFTLIKLVIKLMLPSLLLYILSAYMMTNPFTYLLGMLGMIATFVIFMIALSDVFVGIAILYTKVSGKKAGAIDVEFREID